MKVGMINDGRPVILLEKSEIDSAIKVLKALRFRTEEAKQGVAWAIIKLYLIRRMK